VRRTAHRLRPRSLRGGDERPARTALAGLAATHTGSTAFAQAVLDTGLLGRELAGQPDFVARVAEFRDILTAQGPATAAAEANQASPVTIPA